MHIKNFKASLLVFMLLSAIAESSIASDWIKVASMNDFSVFVDMQSLRRTGLKVKVWNKIVFTSPQEVEGSYPKKTYNLSRELYAMRCDKKTCELLQYVHYADQETQSTVVQQHSFTDTPSRYLEVVPDSINDIVLQFVCRVTATEPSHQ